MQCRDAQFYLRLRRHAGDELGAEVTADLDRHLATCPACAADARAAESFDRAVGAALRAVPVPAGLREKLLTQASAYRGGVIRRKAYRVAALAASLFFGAGLAFGLFSANRPKVDTHAMAQRAAEQKSKPDLVIEQWLADHRLPPQLPLPFDTGLLVHAGTERIDGADVPVAVFRHRTRLDASAKLYAFRNSGFRFENLQPAQASPDTVARVVGDGRQFRGVTYVAIYPEGPEGLEPFLRPGGSG